ncbi:DUF4328 domain-containing protein [Streptomyces sp. NPDC041068]|uniref:DUF4328 domain-containing protein n=1 Tax=Streptomyces sp. NPDC041068 TaxID=3155130 RepID=UPI0033DC7905
MQYQPFPPQQPYVPAGPPAWLRSPVGLSRAVMVLLGVAAVVDLYSLWAGIVMRDVTSDLISGTFGADVEQEAERADSLYAASGFLQVAALIATAVVFIVWFHRVRVNAEVFAPNEHQKKRGWAVWGWLVPIVNLWFPRRIALDIWNASDTRTNHDSPGILNAWWSLWVADLLVGRWASRTYMRAEEPEEIKSAVANMMIADVLDIVAAILAIVFVHRLTRMQDLKARSGPPQFQPPQFQAPQGPHVAP